MDSRGSWEVGGVWGEVGGLMMTIGKREGMMRGGCSATGRSLQFLCHCKRRNPEMFLLTVWHL